MNLPHESFDGMIVHSFAHHMSRHNNQRLRESSLKLFNHGSDFESPE